MSDLERKVVVVLVGHVVSNLYLFFSSFFNLSFKRYMNRCCLVL